MHMLLLPFLYLTLLVPAALSQIPGSTSIFYLTNCNTASGEVSQVAFYSDQSQSKDGQTPDLSITSSDVKTWEGIGYTWTITATWTIFEQISSGAADPSVPIFGFAGCGQLQTECPDGSCATRSVYNCFKDNARVLYTSDSTTCFSLYFCAYRTEDGECPGK